MHALFLYTQFLFVAMALATGAGFTTYKKWKKGYIKWFVFYLSLITILVGINSVLIHFKKQNEFVVLNQATVAIEMLFINWFFYKSLPSRFKILPVIGSLFYCSALVFEKYNFVNSGYYFESLSYTVGNLFTLVYAIIYFIDLIGSDKLLHFYRLATFWIVLGILIFYLGTFPFFGLYNELIKNLAIFTPAAWVATTLNYTMYILFSIGMIWGKEA